MPNMERLPLGPDTFVQSTCATCSKCHSLDPSTKQRSVCGYCIMLCATCWNDLQEEMRENCKNWMAGRYTVVPT